MILEKILSLLTAVVEFVAKTILFLLSALGLWIPALYSIIFIIICAILQVQFTTVLGLYFVGLAMSLIFAFYLICLKMIRKKNRRYVEKEKKRQAAADQKEAKRIIKENKRKNKKGNEEVENGAEQVQIPQVAPTPQPIPQTVQYPTASDNGFMAYPPPYTAPANTGAPQFAQYESPMPGVTNQPNAQASQPVYNQYGQFMGFAQVGSQPAPQPAPNPYDPFPSQESRFNQIEESRNENKPQDSRPLETPKVFKTRMDPDLLIYEFSDRLVFYRTTDGKMEHVHTEWKKK